MSNLFLFSIISSFFLCNSYPNKITPYTPVIAEFGTLYTVVLYLPKTFTNERSILSLSLSLLPPLAHTLPLSYSFLFILSLTFSLCVPHSTHHVFDLLLVPGTSLLDRPRGRQQQHTYTEKKERPGNYLQS